MEYAGQVKQEDEDWVANVRVPQEATDADIQKRVDDRCGAE